MADKTVWDNRDRLDTTLQQGGTADMVTGGTGTYSYAPGAGTIAYVERMNLYMRDASKFQGQGYGEGTVLATGITVQVTDSAGTAAVLTPEPVKSIGHWGLAAGVDVNLSDFLNGEDWFLIRWTFSKGGAALCLDGDASASLDFVLPDSIAHLTYHVAAIQGGVTS